MWGAGKKMQSILTSHHLHTLGDLQTVDPKKLTEWIGANAAHRFRQRAFGIDDRALETGTAEKSISNETTFREDQTESTVVEAALLNLADKVGGRLRKAGYYAATLQIKIRWTDFTTITRQRRLDPPCCDDRTLRETALELLRKEGIHRPVRLIGLCTSSLRDTPDAPQLDLFQSSKKQISKKRESLSRAVDSIRDQFGGTSIQRGSSMKNRP